MLAIGGLKNVAAGLVGGLVGQDITAKSFNSTGAGAGTPGYSFASYDLRLQWTPGPLYLSCDASGIYTNAVIRPSSAGGAGIGSSASPFGASYFTASSGSVALQVNTAGARLKLSSGGTTDYLTSDGATALIAAGVFRVSGGLQSYLSSNSTHLILRETGNNYEFKHIVSNAAGTDPLYKIYNNSTQLLWQWDGDGGNVQTCVGTPSASSTLANVGGLLTLDTTAVGNVGAGTDDLISYSLPANALTGSGRGILVKAWGTTANNANAKTVTLNWGSQVIMTQALTTSIAGTWRIEAIIGRTGASTQDVFAELLQLSTIIHKHTLTAGTQTETGAIVIKCTGTATADNDIVQEGLLVRYI